MLRRVFLKAVAASPLAVIPTKAKSARSIGLNDRNGTPIREGDRFRCKIRYHWNRDYGDEMEGTIKWAKYKAGYTLQIGNRTIAAFRGGEWMPELRELPDGRIDGEVLNT